ncbi:MAG: hypothetical protein ABFS35_22305 [Bacteroidota bacterium]
MEESVKTYYEQLSKAFFESSVQFDKQILFISSGALGLSFTFIKDIVDLESAIYKWLLIISWVLFVIIIFFSLLTHYISIQAINTRIENIETNTDRKSKNLNFIVKTINRLMIFLIALGLLSLILFVFVNI